MRKSKCRNIFYSRMSLVNLGKCLRILLIYRVFHKILPKGNQLKLLIKTYYQIQKSLIQILIRILV